MLAPQYSPFICNESPMPFARVAWTSLGARWRFCGLTLRSRAIVTAGFAASGQGVPQTTGSQQPGTRIRHPAPGR